MPRYTYVIAFPVLVALCIGINVHRYPSVSAMLSGETVESRWLGRSDFFNWQKAETASYQGYNSDADAVVDSRSSREPIPLSGSRYTSSYPASSDRDTTRDTNAASSASSSRYADSYDSGPTNGGSSSYGTSSYGSGSYDNDYDSYDYGRSDYDSYRDFPYESSPYGGSYHSSYDSGSYDSGSAGSNSSLYGSSPYSSDSYGSGSYDNRYDSDSRNTSSDGSGLTSPPQRSGYGLYDDESDDNAGYGGDTWSNGYRSDAPQPGYTSRYAPESMTDMTASTTTPDQTASAEQDSDAQTAVGGTRRTLSPKEKLDLRLAIPFALTTTRSADGDSDVYIPPDFLPATGSEIGARLFDPSGEPAVTISPVTFGTTPTDTPPVTPPPTDSDATSDSDEESDSE